jgi:SAM-dependent methyltransferase
MMPQKDKDITIERYKKRYLEFGYSPKTLGWDKGKQDLRYHVLFEEFDIENKSILDIGCGFGDANLLLKHKTSSYTYVGIDIVEELILEARKKYADEKYVTFLVEDFLQCELRQQFDIVVASGIFNFKLHNADNYAFIKSFMSKAFGLAKEGVAFDFLSDRVDFQYEHTFHSNPMIILEMAYSFSKNVVLKNNYMPFEFCVTLFKDQSFSKEDTIFGRYKNEKSYYRFY